MAGTTLCAFIGSDAHDWKPKEGEVATGGGGANAAKGLGGIFDGSIGGIMLFAISYGFLPA
jgi:hypothetical protein